MKRESIRVRVPSWAHGLLGLVVRAASIRGVVMGSNPVAVPFLCLFAETVDRLRSERSARNGV